MYLMVTAPDGKVISDATNGGSLTTRTDGDKQFTAKIPVEYTQGTRKDVQFPDPPERDFSKRITRLKFIITGSKSVKV